MGMKIMFRHNQSNIYKKVQLLNNKVKDLEKMRHILEGKNLQGLKTEDSNDLNPVGSVMVLSGETGQLKRLRICIFGKEWYGSKEMMVCYMYVEDIKDYMSPNQGRNDR